MIVQTINLLTKGKMHPNTDPFALWTAQNEDMSPYQVTGDKSEAFMLDINGIRLIQLENYIIETVQYTYLVVFDNCELIRYK